VGNRESAVGHVVDDLREGYFVLAAVLDQVAAITAGSRHPLLARSRRRRHDARVLADRAEHAINTGFGHLRGVPGAPPFGSIGDVVAVLTAARTRVDEVAVRLEHLREGIASARTHLLEGEEWSPEIGKAIEQWRLAGEHLDLMVVRLQVGLTALDTYADGVSGDEPGPSREARLAGLLPHTRGPAGEILAGATTAGRLIATNPDHRYAPAAGPKTPCRRLLSAVRHRRSPLSMWPPGGAWPGGVDAKFCAWALLRLLTDDVRRHERWLHHIAARNTAHLYAGYLAAAFLLAVERRFRPGQDPELIDRFVTTARSRYDPDGTALHPAVAGWLIRVALGEPGPDRDRPAGPTRLVAAQTVLLVSLLVDEGLSRDELDDFLAEAGRLLAANRAASSAIDDARPARSAPGDTEAARSAPGDTGPVGPVPGDTEPVGPVPGDSPSARREPDESPEPPGP
jgi:hypothetical protein